MAKQRLVEIKTYTSESGGKVYVISQSIKDLSLYEKSVKPDCCLTGLSSTIACSSELGPRPIWRSVWEISPEYSLEGQMLKLKLQYSGHLMRRTDSLEKTLMLGKIEGKRRRGDRG